MTSFKIPHLIVWSLAMSLLTRTTTATDAALPEPAARPFPLTDVRLLDGPFKRAMELDQAYLLHLEPDRLLVGFRQNAGLPAKAKAYGGWESRGLAGQTLGHYLSACSMMYAATGNERFLDRVNVCVDELAAYQAADGFLAGMPRGRELFDEIARGRLGPSGGFDLNGAWVPWYNQHKLFAGLRDAVTYAGHAKAKAVLQRLGDWAIAVCANLDDRQMQAMLAVEHGGMNEVLADLSTITDERKYLDLAERFWMRPVLDPLAAGRDELTGHHANTQIPKVIGAARLYELTGQAKYKTTAETFWSAVTERRSFVTGSNSDRENFFPPGQEAKRLGPQNGESCNVYNMLKLTKHVAAWSGQAKPYDYYERAMLNHVLGSIDPKTGMTTYFQSLKPGHFKVYGTPHDSFWCCTGTGLESHAKYAEHIYARSNDDTLRVNLFVASELQWKDKGVTVRQQTAFPESDNTALTFKTNGPTKLRLRIRVPDWAAEGISVTGAATARAEAGSDVLDIERVWNNGDSVMVRMPMRLAVHRASDDPTVAAFSYGPVVLAAELGRENFPAQDNVADHMKFDRLPTPSVPMIVTDATGLNWLRPIDGRPLHFRTVDVGRPTELTFAPFYSTHHQRYAVYNRLVTPGQYETIRQQQAEAEKTARERAARTVDEVTFGEQQPEKDHAVASEQSRTGHFRDRPWRDAASGGFFSVRMAVRPDAAQLIRCTYWGSDTGGRTFDIVVDGTVVAAQTLDGRHPDAFYDVDYPIPAALTNRKSHVTVLFRPHKGAIAGGVFGCRILTAAP